MEQVEAAPPLTSKPAEYQPVPIVPAEMNANYPTITTVPQTFITQDPPHYSGSRPNNFLVLTLIALFCCCCWPALFCAIIGVIHSLQVDFAWDVGHHSGSRKASENAKKWGIAAIVTGVVLLAIFITLNVVGYVTNRSAYSSYNRY